MTPFTRGAVAALAVSAIYLNAGAASASPSHKQDPVGDVDATSAASQAQRDTVDITAVRYDVRDERLVITTTFGGLDRTPGRQFVQSEVGTGGSTFKVSSSVDRRVVTVTSDEGVVRCEGTDSFTDYDQHRVLQYVPVECFQVDMVRIKTSSKLVTSNGKKIARDGVVRSGDIQLTFGGAGRS